MQERRRREGWGSATACRTRSAAVAAALTHTAADARTHAPPFQEPAVAPAAAPAAAAASAPAAAPPPLLLCLSFVLGVGAGGGPGLSECQSAGTPRPNRQNGGPSSAFVGTLWHSDCLVRFFNKKS